MTQPSRRGRAAVCLIAILTLLCAASPASAKAAPAPPKLALGGSGTVTIGKAVALKLRASNAGRARTTAFRARVTASSCARVRPARVRIPAIRAGRSITRTIRVTVGRRCAKRKPVVVNVRAKIGRRSIRTTVRLRIGRPVPGLPGARPPAPTPAPAPAPGPAPAPAPAPAPSPLAGTYWVTTYAYGATYKNDGLFFVDGTNVHVGIPVGGAPACTAPGAPSPQCKAYAFDAATGALTIDGRPATLPADRSTVSFDGRTYLPLSVPQPGARFVAYLKNVHTSEGCPLFCTVITTYMGFLADGRFHVNAGSIDSATPAQQGTYEVTAPGTIRFSYLDGNVETRSVGVRRNDAGQPDPQGEGMFLNDLPFY